MRLILPLLAFLLAAALLAAALPAAAPWPQGKSYAVRLTYDDGTETHILNAAVALDLRGLKATFYPLGASQSVSANPKAWSALLARGHELGSHTMTHPCPGKDGEAWPPKAQWLQGYDEAAYAAELDQSLGFLKRLGAKPPFSLAWPCGAAWVGEDRRDVTPLARERFAAARDAWGGAADPATVDLLHVPSVDGARHLKLSLSELAQARAQGRWLVFMFHGVEGDYLSVDIDTHDALLDALAADPQVWVAPFGQVAARVRAHQKKP